jgi:hypothetical protein
MPTTKATSPKPQTPFLVKVPWEWNFVPQAGIPTRDRCQSIIADDERKAGEEIIFAYRQQEAIVDAKESRVGRLNSDAAGVFLPS